MSPLDFRIGERVSYGGMRPSVYSEPRKVLIGATNTRERWMVAVHYDYPCGALTSAVRDVYCDDCAPYFPPDLGPFTGNGWTEQSAWLKAARKVAPVPVSPERARAIVDGARALAEHGPWCDQLDRVTSQAEHRAILDVWDAMPGDRSFVDALLSIANPSQETTP